MCLMETREMVSSTPSSCRGAGGTAITWKRKEHTSMVNLAGQVIGVYLEKEGKKKRKQDCQNFTSGDK